MPALSVSVDNAPIATVSTVGYDMVTVRASCNVVDEGFVDLEVAASNQADGSEPTYHTYVFGLALRPGQKVKIEMLESGANSHAGKTMDELFPDDEPLPADFDFTPTPEVFNELRKKPRLREKFSFRIESSSGAKFVGDAASGFYVFSLSVLWHAWSPDSTSVSLHSQTLDGLEQQAPLTSYFEERIHAGDSILFEPIA